MGYHTTKHLSYQKNIHCKNELKKTMVNLAKVVLIDRNFYNFFGWTKLSININKTQKVISVVNQT